MGLKTNHCNEVKKHTNRYQDGYRKQDKQYGFILFDVNTIEKVLTVREVVGRFCRAPLC